MRTLRWALFALSAAVTAQAQLTESIEVNITNVDVVVTDRAGRPVQGLTKDDFEVFEGGDRQSLTNFYEIRGDAAQLAEEAVDREPGPNAAPAPPEVRQRKIVIFVDNLSIHPFARTKAMASLEKSLDSLMRQGDEATVVFWDRRLRVAVPFTSDRTGLIAKTREEVKRSAAAQTMMATRAQVLERAYEALRDTTFKGKGSKSKGGARAEAYFLANMYAEELREAHLGLIADVKRTTTMLAGLEGKKVLIYLGAQLEENPGLELYHQLHQIFGPEEGMDLPPEFTQSGRNIARELRSVAVEANANNVTMYMVDTADHDSVGDASTPYMPSPMARAVDETNTPMAMSMIASMTGGLMLKGGEGFDAALQTIASDLSSYYSLGYRSPEGKGNRRIVVKVKRDGVRVRSRSSYVAKDNEEDVQDRVVANLFNRTLQSDFPVAVETGTPEKQSNGRYAIPVTVTLPSSMTLIPQDDELVGGFAVYIATGKEDGALSSVAKAVQPLKFSGDAAAQLEEQGTFTYTTTLEVRKGEQIVSVGVTDTIAGTVGFARTKIVAQ
jgi:VWFA-related protein